MKNITRSLSSLQRLFDAFEPEFSRPLLFVIWKVIAAVRSFLQSRGHTRECRLGTQTSWLQHNSREPFAIVKGLGERLLGEPDMDPDEKQEILDSIKRHTDRLGQILVLLHDLVSSAKASPADVAIPDLLESVVSELDREDTVLDVQVVAPEISVLGRKKYLQVALLFILKNARDALIGNPFGRIHIDVTTDNESVFVDIRDNGVGMTDAELTRCIQPGFSSKPPGEGSGLGLSAAYSIIASHGGRLTLQSEKGKGTTCRVELPSKK